MTEDEIPAMSLLNKAVEDAAKPTTIGMITHPKLMRTRGLMAEAVDQSLQYNLNRIDDLIDKLTALKSKLIEGAQAVKVEIDGHYAYAGEALDFADRIAARFLEIEENGHAQAEAATGAAGVGSGEPDHPGAGRATDDPGAAA